LFYTPSLGFSGSHISIAVYPKGPINGIAFVDCSILNKQMLSLKFACFLTGRFLQIHSSGFRIIAVNSADVGLICWMMARIHVLGVVNSFLFYATIVGFHVADWRFGALCPTMTL